MSLTEECTLKLNEFVFQAWWPLDRGVFRISKRGQISSGHYSFTEGAAKPCFPIFFLWLKGAMAQCPPKHATGPLWLDFVGYHHTQSVPILLLVPVACGRLNYQHIQEGVHRPTRIFDIRIRVGPLYTVEPVLSKSWPRRLYICCGIYPCHARRYKTFSRCTQLNSTRIEIWFAPIVGKFLYLKLGKS